MPICVRCKRDRAQGFEISRQFYCVTCLELDDPLTPIIKEVPSVVDDHAIPNDVESPEHADDDSETA